MSLIQSKSSLDHQSRGKIFSLSVRRKNQRSLAICRELIGVSPPEHQHRVLIGVKSLGCNCHCPGCHHLPSCGEWSGDKQWWEWIVWIGPSQQSTIAGIMTIGSPWLTPLRDQPSPSSSHSHITQTLSSMQIMSNLTPAAARTKQLDGC